MHNTSPDTFFAPPKRIPTEELQQLAERLVDDPIVKVLLDAVNGYVLILNEQRQVLAANNEVLEALNFKSPICLIGLRPGEVFSCEHFMEGPSGCGTAIHCQTCGAVISILQSQEENQPAVRECRMSIKHQGKRQAGEFQIRSTPLVVGNEKLTVFVLKDISSDKRRQALERVFFHDLLNTVGGMRGWIEMLRKNKDPLSAAQKIVKLSERLNEEINEHRILLQAEEGNLQTHFKPTTAREILTALHGNFEAHEAAVGKNLDIAPPADESLFTTDTVLLLRVLNNMVKNALEATPTGGTVRVWFEPSGDGRPAFHVHNDQPIPADIQRHIFERSFSTKANQGRGLGAYSMKLFGEDHLQGQVGFTTNPKEGTRFYILLPKQK